ncbi:MAG: hypothetical protein ICV85_05115 [Tolypothrix sp. T3-bin4]|nr:hypothetical protein [Tolypothrix sp. T3-bin4]
MIISELDYMEVIRQENRIEGGIQLLSGSTQAVVGFSTSGGVSVNGNSFANASQQPFSISTPFAIVVGTLYQTSAYSSSNAGPSAS